MARQSQPTFGKLEQEKLLRVLGEARRELIAAGFAMERRSVAKGATETIVRNIDELAGSLTGDRQHFWGKPHG